MTLWDLATAAARLLSLLILALALTGLWALMTERTR